MANNKNIMIVKENQDGNEFPLILEELIPIHSSSSLNLEAKESASTEDFNKAVALIWNILMNSSENSSVKSDSKLTELWDSKQVSDA